MTFAFLISGLAGLLVLLGCQSQLVVRSEPSEAQVYLAQDSEKKSLGKTPLTVTPEALEKLNSEEKHPNGFWQLVIEKDGFQTGHYYVPRSAFGSRMTRLDAHLTSGARDDETAKKILEALFSAQRFAQMGEFERAQTEIEKALKLSPGFPRALTMRASFYYLQKRYTESLEWYERALSEDPKLEEASRMVVQIRKLVRQNGASSSEGASP